MTIALTISDPWAAAAFPVAVELGAEVELPATEPKEVEILVVMETAGELVGAGVTRLPLEGEVREDLSLVERVSVVDAVSEAVVVVAAILPLGPYPGK